MPHLLLVEDEPANRELFRRRLERKGYTVATADNGSGAVALAKSERPDLVLMDLALPDVDGWDATRRIKADPVTAHVPVIALSAHATSDARDRALNAGCQDFETKPVNWDVLFRKIEDWLAKAKSAAGAGTPTPPTAPAAVPGAVVPSGAPADALVGEPDVCTVAPKRILVVEDNDANRVMLCRRLNGRGYATAEAATGREALAAVRGQPFDLVLCDIMMPEMDGYEVLTALKSAPETRDVPVIMISALDEMAGVVRCIEMGAEDYLQKPYDSVLLHARINACLDKRRLRDQELTHQNAAVTLTHAVEQLERGEFDPTLLAPVAARRDALGALARAFDRLAREVQSREKRFAPAIPHATQQADDEADLGHQSGPDPMVETMLFRKVKE